MVIMILKMQLMATLVNFSTVPKPMTVNYQVRALRRLNLVSTDCTRQDDPPSHTHFLRHLYLFYFTARRKKRPDMNESVDMKSDRPDTQQSPLRTRARASGHTSGRPDTALPKRCYLSHLDGLRPALQRREGLRAPLKPLPRMRAASEMLCDSCDEQVDALPLAPPDDTGRA